MIHPDKLDVDDIVKKFCILKGIENTQGLSYKMCDKMTEDFIIFLEKEKGFKQLQTKTVLFSD